MNWAQFDFAYMYFYSERPGTLAARQYKDDVPEDVKKRRLSEIIMQQSKISLEKNQARVGKIFKVLIDGESKRSGDDFKGRNDENIVCVFPKKENWKVGDYVQVRINRGTQTSLIGEIVS